MFNSKCTIDNSKFIIQNHTRVMAKTEISTIGEFGLIKHLTKDIQHVQPSTQKGVGDDAAVMNFGSKRVLMTTDRLL